MQPTVRCNAELSDETTKAVGIMEENDNPEFCSLSQKERITAQTLLVFDLSFLPAKITLKTHAVST